MGNELHLRNRLIISLENLGFAPFLRRKPPPASLFMGFVEPRLFHSASEGRMKKHFRSNI